MTLCGLPSLEQALPSLEQVFPSLEQAEQTLGTCRTGPY